MKIDESNQLFAEISKEESSHLNGGSTSSFINRITVASGAWRFLPFVRPIIARGQWDAFLRGGTKGQLDYLLGMANRLTRF